MGRALQQAAQPAPQLTLQQARHLQLAAQGLLTPPTRSATPPALRRCIQRMQLLQIDTIHVVARSPYWVLFLRLGSYPPVWLDRALARAYLFEACAHEACFAPVEDLALHRVYNQQTRRHWGIAKGEVSHAKQLWRAGWPPPTPRCCHRSTRWCGPANVPWPCLALTTVFNVRHGTPRHRWM